MVPERDAAGIESTDHGVRRRGTLVLLGVLGSVMTLVAWLYASPPGSSPDDGYHLGSIWCAAGYVDGRCVEAPGRADPDTAFMPAVLAQLTCVAGDGRVSAACQNDIYARLEAQLALTSANITGVRAALYYRTANVLVTDDISASIARIRIMNASLVILLVGLTALVAPPDVRRAVLAAWLVASVPLGLFITTSLNSGAWGFVGLGTIWANMLTALRPGEGMRRAAATVLAVVGAIMALGARTEAGAHLSVIGVAVLLLVLLESRGPTTGRLTGRSLIRILVPTGLALVAIGLTLRFAALDYLLGSISGLTAGWDRLVARGISNPAVTLAIEAPQLWTGALGTWSLGWLDTNMPSTVSVSATVGFVTLATLGLAGASRPRIAAVTVVLTGLLALPVISLMSVGLVVLESLQPRHYAPLLYVLLGLALVRSAGQPPLVIGRGVRNSIAAALTIGHSVALAVNIHRYTSGLTEFLYIDSSREVEWWWGGAAPSPEAVWAMGTAGYAVVAFIILGALTASRAASPETRATQPASR